MSTMFALPDSRVTDAGYAAGMGTEELEKSPGILILSGEDKVVHINHTAWVLVQQLQKVEGRNARGVFPAAVREIGEELRKAARGDASGKAPEQIEVRRMAEGDDRAVLLIGLVLPNSHEATGPRILILLHALPSALERTSNVKERYQLSEREYAVVQRLTKGWTNKEIGNDLGIHESTVKAHVAHIMQKTKCTTRTAIVAQFLLPS